MKKLILGILVLALVALAVGGCGGKEEKKAAAPAGDKGKVVVKVGATPDVYKRQAYARATLHEDFMKSRITLIGCPKLDLVDYAEKLTAILENNTIKNVTIVRMEVPCCGGLEVAAKEALQKSGKFIPWQVVTLSLNGEVLED